MRWKNKITSRKSGDERMGGGADWCFEEMEDLNNVQARRLVVATAEKAGREAENLFPVPLPFTNPVS